MWFTILFFVFLAYWVVTIVLLVADDREPSLTLAWLFIIVFMPFIGLLFYFFFGRDWKVVASRHGWVARLRAVQRDRMHEVYERNAASWERFEAEWAGHPAEHVARTIHAEDGTPVLPASSVELFTEGAAKFSRLQRDLMAARRFIHLQYFIWEQDDLTAEITAILLERLDAGVEVRIMYDFIGCLSFKKDELQRLRAAGAQVRADITDLARVNYRNHRKIVVIDGEIGYTGGMNMGQEYIDGGHRFASWRDTHLRLTGQAVALLERMFASRWYERRKGREDLFVERYMPAPDPEAARDGTLVQIVAQGVEDPWSSARRAHMVAMAQARRSIHIQSPYFVPDFSIYDLLINAALSGLDVRFMMTGIPDKYTAFWAAQSYYHKLLAAGGRIFLYDAGFFHAKTMVIDGELAAVGTMNMDNRSLKLHKELMVWVYDKGFARQVEDSITADEEHCTEIMLEDILAVGRLPRFRNQAMRLFSNVL